MRMTLGHLRHRALGVVFVLVLVAAVYLTYAVFTQRFTRYDEVELRTSSIGLQLPRRADVKVRGVIVGEVLGFAADPADAGGAVVTLGLDPDKIAEIPRDVTGSIVPKTLFGEKYVSLVIPDRPSSEHLEAGQTIRRTRVATEVEEVLGDLYPLLRTVQPADLNTTLNAIATALEGRGDQLGRNLETVDRYLARLNPQLPALVEDLRLTARVSDTYADVLPQVAQILDDTVRTTGTLEGRAARLRALFADVSSFADTAHGFLDRNGDDLIRLSRIGAAQLGVLAKYAPEYPCLTRGIVNAGRRQAQAFRDFTLHIVLETLPNQPRAYGPQDRPHFGDRRGPACLHLPNPPWSQEHPLRHQPDFDDGVDEPTGKGISRPAPAQYLRTRVGTPAEAAVLRSVLGPALGVRPDRVPDLGLLLVGPLARGAEVSLR
jgi:phospholipid/cholesterol/gamma-HCH transport system substrate-binding protein